MYSMTSWCARPAKLPRKRFRNYWISLCETFDVELRKESMRSHGTVGLRSRDQVNAGSITTRILA